MNTEKEIKAFWGNIDGGRVLDVATATGGTIGWLLEDLQSYDEAIGIDNRDLREQMPEDSIFNRDNVSFKQMDAYQMTFADASFDTVVIGNSLHHLTGPGQVLAEMQRVLKPGGRFVVVEMYRDNQTETQMTHVQLHHWWAEIDRARGVTHEETYTRAELVALVEPLDINEWTIFDFADLESDPKEAQQTATLKSYVDMYVERAKEMPNLETLQAQADQLNRRLDEVGFHGATSLIAVGQK